MFINFIPVQKQSKWQSFFTFHICCMLSIHLFFLLLPPRGISNHLDISSIHKARKFHLSTSFITQWKTSLPSSLHQCIFANFSNERKHFCPRKLIFYFRKGICGGNCKGSKVKVRFFCGWFCYKVNLQNYKTKPREETGEEAAGGLRGRDRCWSLAIWVEWKSWFKGRGVSGQTNASAWLVWGLLLPPASVQNCAGSVVCHAFCLLKSVGNCRMLSDEQNCGLLHPPSSQTLGSLMEREALLSWDVRRGAGCESNANSYSCLLSGRCEMKLKGFAQGAGEIVVLKKKKEKERDRFKFWVFWSFGGTETSQGILSFQWPITGSDYLREEKGRRQLSTVGKLVPCLVSHSKEQAREVCGGVFSFFFRWPLMGIQVISN